MFPDCKHVTGSLDKNRGFYKSCHSGLKDTWQDWMITVSDQALMV